MKVGTVKTDRGSRYFLISRNMEMLDWEIFLDRSYPDALREAVTEALKSCGNEQFCSALPIIEQYLMNSPEMLHRQRGLRQRWEPNLRLEPPVIPRSFICVGLNYRDHAREAGMKIPAQPIVFAKTGNALNGHNCPVFLPPASSLVDYEAELAVVIGRKCQCVAPECALQFVAGYTCANDISARDFQHQESQWYRGKSADGFGPIGPWIVTPSEIRDPHKLSIKLRLNGRTLQDSNTCHLIFPVPYLISYISETITLVPGDVILTGTPPGVGYARKPPVGLRPGDRLEVEIDSIGVLINTVASR